MKRFLGWLDRRWYLFLAGGCIGAELLVFLIFRENSYFTVQDNLDLFVAHFQVLDLKKTWMAKLHDDCLFISAKNKDNIDEFREVLYKKVRELHVQKYPYNDFLYQDYE